MPKTKKIKSDVINDNDNDNKNNSLNKKIKKIQTLKIEQLTKNFINNNVIILHE